MDFGAVGLEGLVGSVDTAAALASFASSDREKKQQWFGSEFIKHERSGINEDDWSSSKLSRTTESMLLPQRKTSLKSKTTPFTEGQQQPQILSFSCPKSKALSVERSTQNPSFPGCHPTSSVHSISTGYSYGSFSGANINMHGVFTETRGPFTPSQWMELEHQALIYKYITSNVPIPSNLLNPIRKALDSAVSSGYSGGILRPNTLSWGTFHLGFSSNTDPEPGRCRRTDGKKWRCSRDAVADQKYCERHLNRGRHRSRKHVEGQSGHSAAAATTATEKPMPSASSPVAASVVGLNGSGTSNSLGIVEHQPQLKVLQLDNSTPLSRMFLNKEDLGERLQESPSLYMLSSEIDLKSKENFFFISKQQNPYQDCSQIEFGLVNSDSLLNPSQNSSSLFSSRNFCSSQDLANQETMSQHCVRQLIEDWPKSQSDHSAVSLPQIDVQPDRTQLSVSVPTASADLMPSASSSNNEVSCSPQRLSHDLDAIHTGMGLGIVLNEQNQRQANWTSFPWEISTGGPLGEVLHNTNNSISECKNSSVLNLLAEGWDMSPQIGSSPTGVLQKTTFCSLSNSSEGSSPREKSKRFNEGASLCNDLGSSLVQPSSLPAL